MNHLHSDIVGVRALDRRVLAVAVARLDGWCAYIGAVAGVSHDNEKHEVKQSGSKLREAEAAAIFPWIGSQFGDYVP